MSRCRTHKLLLKWTRLHFELGLSALRVAREMGMVDSNCPVGEPSCASCLIGPWNHGATEPMGDLMPRGWGEGPSFDRESFYAGRSRDFPPSGIGCSCTTSWGGIGFTHHLICGAVVGKVRDEDRAFVVDCGVPVSVFLPPGMSPNEGEMIEVTGRLDATLIREMDPLFTLPAEYRELLEMPPGSNSRLLENQFIKEFERHGISLGGPVWVSITGDGKEFRVDASESREFFIVETARDLAVYPPP